MQRRVYPSVLDHILFSWRITRAYFDTIRTLSTVMDESPYPSRFECRDSTQNCQRLHSKLSTENDALVASRPDRMWWTSTPGLINEIGIYFVASDERRVVCVMFSDVSPENLNSTWYASSLTVYVQVHDVVPRRILQKGSAHTPFLYIDSQYMVFNVRTRQFYEFPECSALVCGGRYRLSVSYVNANQNLGQPTVWLALRSCDGPLVGLFATARTILFILLYHRRYRHIRYCFPSPQSHPKFVRLSCIDLWITLFSNPPPPKIPNLVAGGTLGRRRTWLLSTCFQ